MSKALKPVTISLVEHWNQLQFH